MQQGRRRSASRTSTYLPSTKRAMRSGSTGPRVPQVEFLDEVGGDGVELVLGGAEAHLPQGHLGGVDGAGRGEQPQEEGLRLLAVAAVEAGRQRAGSEGAAAGAWHLDLDGQRAHHQGALVRAVALVGAAGAVEVGPPLGHAHAREQGAQQLAHAQLPEAGGGQALELGLGDLSDPVRCYASLRICSHRLTPKKRLVIRIPDPRLHPGVAFCRGSLRSPSGLAPRARDPTRLLLALSTALRPLPGHNVQPTPYLVLEGRYADGSRGLAVALRDVGPSHRRRVVPS